MIHETYHDTPVLPGVYTANPLRPSPFFALHPSRWQVGMSSKIIISLNRNVRLIHYRWFIYRCCNRCPQAFFERSTYRYPGYHG
jgi:hypothetical protein